MNDKVKLDYVIAMVLRCVFYLYMMHLFRITWKICRGIEVEISNPVPREKNQITHLLIKTNVQFI